MTWLDLFGSLNAISAAVLGGVAVAYARFVWTHGNGLRRYMRWLAPAWSLVSFYHAAVWAADAIRPQINTLTWMRPVSWLLLAIPAFSLICALAEDTRNHDEERQAKATLEAAAAGLESSRHGEP